MTITQSSFIDHIISHQKPVALFLTSGIKLLGYLLGHDEMVVLLGGQQKQQLIYKSSISTILLGESLDNELKAALKLTAIRHVA